MDLEGVRGRPRGDLEALAGLVAALSRFAAAHRGDVASVELNPVAVLPAGEGVVALDALVSSVATPQTGSQENTSAETSSG